MDLIDTILDQLRQVFREELVSFHQSNPAQADRQPAELGKTIFNLDQFCEYTGLSKQTAYKLTGKGLVPHSKRGKRLFFLKSEIDNWLLANRVGGISEIERKTDEHMMKNRRRRL